MFPVIKKNIMDKTIIAWTNFSFNPWLGCVKVSDGCKNCYAESLTKNRMGLSVWGKDANRQRTSEGNWKKPLKWNKQAEETGQNLVFCVSLADIFEDNAKLIQWRYDLFQLILQTPNLEWQILTKRPENINRLLPIELPQNVWLGTSVEDERVVERAEILKTTNAKIKFISYEPAIGALAHAIDLTGIDWLIYGGESGPGYRPENKQWARDIMQLCRETGTAFFHKQSSAFRTEMGIELDGQIIREFPDYQKTQTARQEPELF